MNSSREPKRWRDDSDNRDLYEMLATLSGDPPAGMQERVWQRVKDPASSARKPLVWALPVAVAASAGIALVLAWMFFVPQPKAVGQFATMQGQVVIAPAQGEDFETASLDSVVAPGSTVETGAESWAHVKSPRQVEVVAEPNTRFRAGTLAEGKSLSLELGTVVVAVKGPKRANPVVVNAREYSVQVIGTVFSVTRTAKGTIGFAVMEGVVRVAWPEGERELRAGQTLVTDRNEKLPLELPQRALAMLSIPRERITALDPTIVVGENDGMDEPSPDSDGPLVDAALPDPEKGLDEGTAPTRRKKQRSTALTSEAGKTKTEAERLYDEALGARNPGEALAKFDRVSKMKGPWAEVAAYRAARTAAKNRRPDANARLKKLLKKYPRGKFASEARLTLIESYMNSRQFGAASQEIAKFLSHHSDNERVGDVYFLKGEISRIRNKDCHSAVKDYARAMGRTRRTQDVLFWRAWCTHDIGNRSQARSMFKDYLRRYPKGRHAKTAGKMVE